LHNDNYQKVSESVMMRNRSKQPAIATQNEMNPRKVLLSHGRMDKKRKREVIQAIHRETTHIQMGIQRGNWLSQFKVYEVTPQKITEIVTLLQKFNSGLEVFTNIHSYTNDIIDNELSRLLHVLSALAPYCPRVRSFIESFIDEPLEVKMARREEVNCLLTREILSDLNKHAYQPLTEFDRKYKYYRRERGHSLDHEKCEAIIHMLNLFRSWFTENAIALHQFEVRAVFAIEAYWYEFLNTIQLPEYESVIRSMGCTFRPLIITYNHHVENQLMQLRVATNQEQMEHTILSEQYAALEFQYQMNQNRNRDLQIQIARAKIAKDASKESSYKKVLTTISAIFQYDKALKNNRLPVIEEMKGLSRVKKEVTSLFPVVSSQMASDVISEEKKEEIARFSVMRTDLISLNDLHQLNQSSLALLSALEKSSFYLSEKIEYQKKIIKLIKQFNDCFRITNPSHEIAKGNICLHNLIAGIQHSPVSMYYIYFMGTGITKYDPTLFFFEKEGQHDLGKYLKEFLFLYQKIITDSLRESCSHQSEISRSSFMLEQKVDVVRGRIKQNRKLLKLGLISHPNQEECKHEMHGDPYHDAIIQISSMILCAQDIIDSPQLLPVAMTILKHSYTVLMHAHPVLREDVIQPIPYMPMMALKQKTFFNEEKNIAVVDSLSLESLLFIHEYTKIALNQYRKHHPEDNWTFKCQGLTDRLGGYKDRYAEYTKFCNAMREQLEAFSMSMDGEKTLEEANAALVTAMETIQSSVSTDFSHHLRDIYMDEKNQIHRGEANTVFLDWYHLEQLNIMSMELLQDIKSCAHEGGGYLKITPLLEGAIQYFNSQFLQENIRENNGDDQTRRANKALLVMMQIMHYDDTRDKNLSVTGFKCQQFMMHYNKYVEETLKIVLGEIDKKQSNIAFLKMRKSELETQKKKLQKDLILLRKQIQLIIQQRDHTEPLYIEALRKIKGLELQMPMPSPVSSAFSGIFGIATSALNETERSSGFSQSYSSSSSVKSSAGEEEVNEEKSDSIISPELIKISPLLEGRSLSVIRASAGNMMNRLLPFQKTHPKLIDILITSQELLRCLSNVIKIEKANVYLGILLWEIGYALYSHEYDDEIKWELQLFLWRYEKSITLYLQQMRLLDHELRLEIINLNKEVAGLNQELSCYARLQNSLDYSPLIQQILQEERDKNKPAEKAIRAIGDIIFDISQGEMHISMIPVVMGMLKIIFDAVRQENQVSLSRPSV